VVLMIDNYDSFTYNLVQYLGELGAELEVYRNDKITVKEIVKMRPEKIVLSPGPCTPNEAGICIELINELSGKIPILGVCLGHQSIGQAFGGKIIRAPKLFHGKTSSINHDGKGVFSNIKTPFTAIRYHSLIVEKESLPQTFEVSAWTDDGIIMGIRHKKYCVEGVQFHPESILTENGMKILQNFLEMK